MDEIESYVQELLSWIRANYAEGTKEDLKAMIQQAKNHAEAFE